MIPLCRGSISLFGIHGILKQKASSSPILLADGFNSFTSHFDDGTRGGSIDSIRQREEGGKRGEGKTRKERTRNISSPVSSPSQPVMWHDRKEANSIMGFQMLMSHHSFLVYNSGYLQGKAWINKWYVTKFR